MNTKEQQQNTAQTQVPVPTYVGASCYRATKGLFLATTCSKARLACAATAANTASESLGSALPPRSAKAKLPTMWSWKGKTR